MFAFAFSSVQQWLPWKFFGREMIHWICVIHTFSLFGCLLGCLVQYKKGVHFKTRGLTANESVFEPLAQVKQGGVEVSQRHWMAVGREGHMGWADCPLSSPRRSPRPPKPPMGPPIMINYASGHRLP